jgi:uncharacterized protein
MVNPLKIKRRGRLVARFSSAAASATRVWNFAETYSQTARDAIAEANSIIVEEHEIHLRRLPKALDGFRVVQLTDLHHSPFTDAKQIMNAIDLANCLDADIVALTGDYVSHEAEYVAPIAEMMAKVKSKYGTYAILGNHDHWTDGEFMTKCLRDEGIRVLINEGFRFEANGESFWLCGVDDAMASVSDLKSAVKGSLDDEFKLLLSHNPSIISRAARRRIDLVLSGHTHGGQVKIRQQNENSLFPEYRRISGLHRRYETQIYVSRGIGTVVLPVRYQCPPEVSLLILRSV